MSDVTYYSIIRYVPDDVRGEQVNIGAVALRADGSRAVVRFDRDLSRPRALARRADLTFLREFRQSLEDIADEQAGDQLVLAGGAGLALRIDGKPRLDAEFLRNVARRWQNSLQFTEPRGSLESDPQQLLDEVFRRYVAPPTERPRRRARDRRWVVAHASSVLGR